MAKIISGLIDQDGTIYEGTGFKVEVEDFGYRIIFNTLNNKPTLVAQAWEIDDAITCVTPGYLPSPVQVIVATLDKGRNFVRNAFSFIAFLKMVRYSNRNEQTSYEYLSKIFVNKLMRSLNLNLYKS